ADQHDAEEARLEEKGGEHLVGRQQVDDISPAQRQFAPVRAEVVGQDDAGDHVHAEGYGEDLGPLLGDAEIDVLAGLEPQRLEHDEPGGKADGEGRKEDVEGDGEGELDAGKEERIELWHRSLCSCYSRPALGERASPRIEWKQSNAAGA